MISRADRNNNPGNIKLSSWSRNLPGVIGIEQKPAADGGNFLIFDSPQSGLNAMKTLITQGSSYQGINAEQAIKKWNGGGGYGATDVGLNPDQDIQVQLKDPNKLNQVVMSIAKAEGFNGATQAGMTEADKATLVGVINQMQSQGHTHDEISKVVQGFVKDHSDGEVTSGNTSGNPNLNFNPTPFSENTPNNITPANSDAVPKLPQQGITGLSQTIMDKTNKTASSVNNFLNNPDENVGYDFVKSLPSAIGATAHGLVDPELKGIASGVRAIQSTPDAAKGLLGFLQDIAKTRPDVLAKALLHPTQYSSPKADASTIAANKTMAKPLLGQKTLSGSSIKDNAISGITAAAQLAGTKYLPEDPVTLFNEAGSGLSKVGNTVKTAAKVAGKVAKPLLWPAKVLTGGGGILGAATDGLIGYLLGKSSK